MIVKAWHYTLSQVNMYNIEISTYTILIDWDKKGDHLMALREISYNVGFYQKALLEEFLAPRRCMREPIQALFDAAERLERAVDVHLRQDKKTTEQLLAAADLPAVREWTESLWGGKQKNPDQWRYHRWRAIPGLGKPKPKVKDRMPGQEHRLNIIARDGYNCRSAAYR